MRFRNKLLIYYFIYLLFFAGKLTWYFTGVYIIRDYLSGRTHVTTINGCQPQAMPVTIGGTDHRGLVLCPTLFSLYCNDLPNITEGIDGDALLYMYADDTTVYVSAPTYDLLALKLNEVLARVIYMVL